MENIERVIRSHGFNIYTYLPEDKNSPELRLIAEMGMTDIAFHHAAFVATKAFIKAVFIREGYSDDDRLELLFHEEAHIWYDHLNKQNFTDQTVRQQEKVANLFLFKLQMLKAAVYAVPVMALFCWYLLSM